MPLPPRTIAADRGDAGRRIDLVLRRHLTDLPAATRTRVQAWIEGGRVSVNGRIVRRVAARAAFGDQLTVEFPDLQPRARVLPEDLPVERLFEDDHLLVVNKPPGLVSHPTYRHTSGTLVNALLGFARDWPEGQRPSLVGRLDKFTSGLVVVAKTTEVHARMQRTLASAHSDKSYVAVVYGVAPPAGEVNLPLGPDPADRRRVIVAPGGGAGRASLTRFSSLATARVGAESVSLVRCRLVTGRMHQIRVHMAARGWPLVGDPKYGAPRWVTLPDGTARAALSAFGRQALHAWRVAFTHPVSGAAVTVEAPLPADMGALLEACGLPLPRG